MTKRKRPYLQTYFVDEAGDTALFNKKKQLIVGQPGCSRFFMVGVADIPNYYKVKNLLGGLRQKMLADPYFARIPSMRPEAKKTAIAFHANNDAPEVRDEVFKLISTMSARVVVAIRKKEVIAQAIQRTFENSTIKYDENQLYDDLVRQIFRGKLHTATKQCSVFFSRRGKTKRREALFKALEKTKMQFEKKQGKKVHAPLKMFSEFPVDCPGLQIVDYHLWALQRMYEKGDDRYFQMIASRFKLIIDRDDRRNKKCGEHYQVKNPCDLEKIKAHLS